MLGALLGLVVAVVLGVLVYRGALRLDLRKFFTWTGGFLVVVAAGVVSYGVHDLQEAGALPGLHRLAYDVSDSIAPTSIGATIVKGVFNIAPTATWFELGAWAAYLLVVMPVFLRRLRPPVPEPATPPSLDTPGVRS